LKRVLAIAAIVELAFLSVVLHTEIKDFLFVHPWLFSALSAAPALIIASLELLHSGEANRLQEEANRLHREANASQEQASKFYEQANKFREEANAERVRANEALSRIADHTKKAPTKAERNAERLRQYLRAKAQVVNADDSQWPGVAEVVEIKDELVTLFTPAGFSSSSAFAVHVHCDELEIIERSAGKLTLKVLKRYGTTESLGQIRAWEERQNPPAGPLISKGPNVFNAEYTKPGSSERRRLDVYEAVDGSNSYMLQTASGETLYGDNVEISRQFMLIQLELEAQGFRYNGGGTGGNKHQLFIRTRT
jgi:hypothetical protein